jgi:hypothetical protein
MKTVVLIQREGKVKDVSRRALATVLAPRRMRVGCPDPSADPKHPLFFG